jgi:phosphoribosylanthranilate isomerase
MVKVKICGITNREDALAAVGFGADALGFVFAKSPRRVTPEKVRKIITTLPHEVCKVGVFVNETAERIDSILSYCGLDLAQLHGDEDESFVERFRGRVVKAVPVGKGFALSADAYPGALLLLDTYDPLKRGGTGRVFNWRDVKDFARTRPVFIAGGLNPDNVSQAVSEVGPYGVDVSGGAEKEPGKKDHDKIKRFIENAKRFG